MTTIFIPFSDTQREHVMDHLAYGDDLGILRSEYAWITGKAASALKSESLELIKITGAEMDIDGGRWIVSCDARKVL